MFRSVPLWARGAEPARAVCLALLSSRKKSASNLANQSDLVCASVACDGSWMRRITSVGGADDRPWLFKIGGMSDSCRTVRKVDMSKAEPRRDFFVQPCSCPLNLAWVSRKRCVRVAVNHRAAPRMHRTVSPRSYGGPTSAKAGGKEPYRPKY